MPFCKYCYSAGMKRVVYTNHNTFITINNEKQIECRNLAKTKCGKCKQIGHTKKYCTSNNNNAIQPFHLMMQSNSDVLDEMHFRNVFVVQFAIFIIFICIVVILVWSGTIIDESYYTIDEKNDPL